MRLWSIHPKFLDSKGLVALWREALLAQKVLRGETKGYTNHPQLLRFKEKNNPQEFIGTYLLSVFSEAQKRGYSFDRSKILKQLPTKSIRKINVTYGQIIYEFEHLLKKLQTRSPELYKKLNKTQEVELHPLFRKVQGDIADWEKLSKSK